MQRASKIVAMLLGLSLAASAATVYEIYRVVPDDSVQTVAVRYGVSVEELRALNPHLGEGELTSGDLITVPVIDGVGDGASGGVSIREALGPKLAGRLGNGGNQGYSILGNLRAELPASAAESAGALGEADVADTFAEPEARWLDRTGYAEAPPVLNDGGGANGAAGIGRADAPPVVSRAEASPLRKVFAVNGAVGRLGQVVSNGTPIRRDHRDDAPLVYRAGRDAKLVVVNQYNDWYGVLMVDRAICWVRTAFVRLTYTELVDGRDSERWSTPGRHQTDVGYLGPHGMMVVIMVLTW